MQRGTTLLEIVTVVTLVGLLSVLAAPRASRWMDRIAVRRAADEAAVFYGAARFGAIMRGSRVRLEFRAESLAAFYEGLKDSLFLRQDGPAAGGVGLTTSRALIRILPTGIGSGGSNTTLVFRRGFYAESLTTSRLGRLKRWR